jgi:hypothetical protein
MKRKNEREREATESFLSQNLIWFSPLGCIFHYLFSLFGKKFKRLKLDYEL